MFMVTAFSILNIVLIVAAIILGGWISVLLIQFLQLRIRQFRREEAKLD